MISFTAASNSPSSEQQTQPPPSSAIRTFLPSITFASIAISPNSFITMAILVGRVARMCRSKVVLPLPSGPVTRVIGVRSCIRYVRLTLNLTLHESVVAHAVDFSLAADCGDLHCVGIFADIDLPARRRRAGRSRPHTGGKRGSPHRPAIRGLSKKLCPTARFVCD